MKQIHRHGSITSLSLSLSLLFLLDPPIFYTVFLRFSRNEIGEHYFIEHSDAFYTVLFSHYSSTLNFYTKMAKTSAESCVSFKGNNKAISILQNVMKVLWF